MRACFIHSQSVILHSDVLETDYMCSHIQGQVIELIFRDTYIIESYNSGTQPGCISSLWWNESFLTMTSPSRFAAPPGNICPVHHGQIPLSPPSGNKLQHKPCPPYISWKPSRSPLYLTHPGPNLNYFYYNWKTLSKSILELGRRNESEMTIASARRGRLTRSIWNLRFEGPLPLLREVVTVSSGLRL